VSVDSRREWEFQLCYGNLKALRGADPIAAVARTCGFGQGSLEYAKRYWHDVFQDFAELRKFFPEYAAQFGPYTEPAPQLPTEPRDYREYIQAKLAELQAQRAAAALATEKDPPPMGEPKP